VADGARHLARPLLIRDVVPQDGDVRTAADGTWLRATVLGVLLVLGAVLAVLFDLPDVEDARSWVDGAGGAGWTAMVLGLALVLLAPVPRSALAVLVGLVAGFGAGVGVAFTGALLAAVAAFGLSRGLGRTAATRLAGPRLGRVDDLMARRGFVAVLTGRLLPVVPFVVLSYGAGLTAIRWLPYVAGTAVGLMPGTVLQVGIGASASAVADRATPLTVLPLLGAAVALAAFSARAWHRRRRAAPAQLAAPEEPAEHPAGTAHGAGGELEDRAARDARNLLHDRREQEQAADVVHLQPSGGGGRYRVDPARGRL
jgi:uncharacterized membrane protein YdjX (TVP38/TMEM64 family)